LNRLLFFLAEDLLEGDIVIDIEFDIRDDKTCFRLSIG